MPTTTEIRKLVSLEHKLWTGSPKSHQSTVMGNASSVQAKDKTKGKDSSSFLGTITKAFKRRKKERVSLRHDDIADEGDSENASGNKRKKEKGTTVRHFLPKPKMVQIGIVHDRDESTDNNESEDTATRARVDISVSKHAADSSTVDKQGRAPVYTPSPSPPFRRNNEFWDTFWSQGMPFVASFFFIDFRTEVGRRGCGWTVGEGGEGGWGGGGGGVRSAKRSKVAVWNIILPVVFRHARLQLFCFVCLFGFTVLLLLLLLLLFMVQSRFCLRHICPLSLCDHNSIRLGSAFLKMSPRRNGR